MAITVNMVDAIKVKFLKQIFEEDFPERGHGSLAHRH